MSPRANRFRPPPLGPAELYDYAYHWKDYPGEAARVRQILADAGVPDGARVLEAACGTGRYLAALAEWYEPAGFDLDPTTLDVARRKLPDAELFAADLVDFTVERAFDALVCLFGGVSFLAPGDGLAAGAARMFDALAPGGVLVAEPWLTPEQFHPGEAYMLTFEAPNFKLCRMCVARAERGQAILDFHWIVARAGLGVETTIEQVKIWLHPRERVRDALSAAGFAVETVTPGLMPDSALLVGRRP